MNLYYDPVCVLLETPFYKWKEEDKKQVIHQRPMPSLDLNQINSQKSGKSYTRSFKQSIYNKHEWLCGSSELVKLFCWPCLLLSWKKNVWTKVGYCDLHHLPDAIKRHESSTDHLKSECDFKRLIRNMNTISDPLKENYRLSIQVHNEKVRMNRRYMYVLIDAVLLLASQELSFRGYDESTASINPGNFQKILETILKHTSEDLKAHVKKIENVFTGHSTHIQNDIIQVVNDYIFENIINDINAASFFAIQVDDNTDIMQKSQCSIIIRFVNRKGEVTERFLGFYDVSVDRTAQVLFEMVQKVLEKFKNYPTKLIGQCYDGASVMVGHLNGLQKKIKDIANQATFIHCAAHQFNQTLQQGFHNDTETRRFFKTVLGIPEFFHHSYSQTLILDSIVAYHIPTVADVRWSSTSKLLHVIVENWDEFKNTFLKILHHPHCCQPVVVEAYYKKFCNFQFAILAHIFNDIFTTTDTLFDILQKKSVDINYCIKFIENIRAIIQSKRNEQFFQQIFNNVLKKVALPSLKGEINSKENYFKRFKILFFKILDNVLMQFNNRFQDFNKLEFVMLGDSSKFELFSKIFPDSAFNNLIESYETIFHNSSRLKCELQLIYKDLEFRNKTMSEIVLYLMENNLSTTLTEANNLFLIILTLPSTSVSVKHSFSCLNRIKMLPKNTISQEKFSALATLSIEKTFLNNLIKNEPFYEDICDKYGALKDRPIDLIFKK